MPPDLVNYPENSIAMCDYNKTWCLQCVIENYFLIWRNLEHPKRILRNLEQSNRTLKNPKIALVNSERSKRILRNTGLTFDTSF